MHFTTGGTSRLVKLLQTSNFAIQTFFVETYQHFNKAENIRKGQRFRTLPCAKPRTAETVEIRYHHDALTLIPATALTRIIDCVLSNCGGLGWVFYPNLTQSCRKLKALNKTPETRTQAP